MGMRKVLRLPFHQAENTRRSQRQLGYRPSGRIGNSAGDGRSDIQDGNLTGSLGTKRPAGGSALKQLEIDGQCIASHRDTIGFETRLLKSTAFIDRDVFQQSVAQPLHNTTLNLAVNGPAVERPPHILHHTVVQDFDMAGIRVDCHFTIMDCENRNIDSVDKMPGSAARHGGNPWSGKGAAA